MKALKFFIGLCLLPLCWAVTRTLVSLVRLQQAAPGDIPPSAWALLAGFMLWLLIYAGIPLPVRTYVLAHELTHALWATMMGARVKRIRVAEQGGSVSLTKSNFLIALAPYFFPFYTALVVALYFLLSLFFPVERADLWWMGLVGFSWGFHLTFTGSTLARSQTDVQEHGRLFSLALIYFANMLGICLWVVLVSPVSMGDWGRLLAGHGRESFAGLWSELMRAWAWIQEQAWGRRSPLHL